MPYLLLGLVIFLGVHSTRVFAEGWRTATIARMGEKPFKGVYSLASIAGFVLLVVGYAQARGQSPLWVPPHFMHYVTALLMLPVFPLFVASYVPRNGIRAALHHPQVLSVKTWAFAHLLSNGSLADVVLFGSFLVWAVLSFRAARRRDRALGTVYPPGTTRGTVIAVVIGLVAYVVFAGWLHQWLIGVRPV
jgi:uncharacterized membrane protein